jgi:chromosome segregation ATPase
MAKRLVTQEAVDAICDRFKAEGKKITTGTVYEVLGVGSNSTIQVCIEHWLARQQSAPEPATSAVPAIPPQIIAAQTARAEKLVALLAEATTELHGLAEKSAEERVAMALAALHTKEEELRERAATADRMAEDRAKEAEALEDELSALKAAHDTAKDTMARQDATLSDLRGQFGAQAEELIQERQAAAKLGADVAAGRAREDGLHRQAAEVKAAEAEARRLVAERDGEINRLNTDLARVTAERDAKAQQIADLENRLRVAEDEVRQVRKQNSELSHSEAVAVNNLQHSQAELTAIREQAEAQRKALAEALRGAQEAQTRETETRSLFEAARAECTALHAKIATQQQEPKHQKA